LNGEKALNSVIGLQTRFGDNLSSFYYVYKVYVYADVDGSGGVTDVIGWWSKELKKFLRVEYNLLPVLTDCHVEVYADPWFCIWYGYWLDE